MFNIAYRNIKDLDIYNDILINSLSAYRTEKLKSLNNEYLKKKSIGAELLLIQMMCNQYREMTLPLKIKTSETGKPYFCDNSNIFFNLSHSKDMVACVLADKEVGIDIQHMGEYKEEIIPRFFTSDEQNYIESCKNKKLAFYEIWTKKEALLKCKGTGLGAISRESVFEAQKCGYTFTNKIIDEYMLSTCI